MNKFYFIIRIFIIILTSFVFGNSCEAFTPEQPVIKIEQIHPGMKGYALTVIQGRDITRIPLEVISIIPRIESPKNLILIKAPSGIAAGMSGSPVFISGKLAGAIGYGFVNADHTLGMVTPIEEMISVFSWKDKNIKMPGVGKPMNAPLMLNGAGQITAEALSKVLGTNVQLASGGGLGNLPIEENAKLSPGEAVAVFLAWGDVMVASTGTLTTTSKDGRFLAYAHPFLGLGAVNFPIGRAMIHYIVPSNEFPFKIGTPISFVGSVTQDRPQAIGGQVGKFPLSVSASLIFRDKDSGKSARKGFNIVVEPFITPKMISAIFSGLINEEWGRAGHGTVSTTFSVDGRGLNNPWRRSNMFFSESKASEAMSGELNTLLEIFSLNAFYDIYPLGFSLNVEVTEEPRVLFIEGLSFDKEKAAPGETVEVAVKLRPWRKAQQVKSFDLIVPEKASGSCEIVVRGGGVESAQANAVLEGWKSIDSFNRLIKELDAVETNNELVVEFNIGNQDRGNVPPDEYLSEAREKRLQEGSMRVFKSEFVVDGLMRKQFEVLNEKK